MMHKTFIVEAMSSAAEDGTTYDGPSTTQRSGAQYNKGNHTSKQRSQEMQELHRLTSSRRGRLHGGFQQQVCSGVQVHG